MKNVDKFIESACEEIRTEVGKGGAIVALSGGVDSSVVAALAHKALEGRLKSFFIDDGLMRAGEAKTVAGDFKKIGIKVDVVNVQEQFFSALKGHIDPEEKRKAFRDTFYRVLGDCLRDSKATHMLQGTIAADIIETQKGVKTQHNVLEQIGFSPARYGLKVLEPVRTLFKPQVREVGRKLGLPEHMCARMPFPGPGLATRVLGEVTPERVEILRKATVIVEEEIVSLKPFQAFAVLFNDQATGVKNGKRLFGNIIAVRSVDSTDAMTATPTEVPWKTMMTLAKRITEEVPTVVKVVYDLSSKPPSTIEYI
ncbi:MAG: glutamine-hydrolyzing GMP synthase [Planctomycetota bacterium]|nr:glutamine-hydrolyzing GMP synthase [Planctomycetota bacterium]